MESRQTEQGKLLKLNCLLNHMWTKEEAVGRRMKNDDGKKLELMNSHAEEIW